ncbi:hypothetical protein A2U01_0076652, partial [Trifolium medium]|nr:hypothetical protein [Trifolium medium]
MQSCMAMDKWQPCRSGSPSPSRARVNEVMLETQHGLCTWPLLQNGIKHFGTFMKG